MGSDTAESSVGQVEEGGPGRTQNDDSGSVDTGGPLFTESGIDAAGQLQSNKAEGLAQRTVYVY